MYLVVLCLMLELVVMGRLSSITYNPPLALDFVFFGLAILYPKFIS